MQKPSIIMSVFLTVLIPIAILLLSSNLVLRMPLTYEFYFNDAQTLDEIDYSIAVSTMGNSIGKYLSSPGSAKFQVYEKNGSFKDAVFKSKEQKVMSNYKTFLFRQALIALAVIIIALLIYVNTVRSKLKDLLRLETRIAMGVTGFLLLLQLILIGQKGFREMLYSHVIGIKLSKTSTLSVVFGGGDIYGTYLMFATIAGLVILLLFIYVNHRFTKPDRIFYYRR